jgi:hypothetical protein
VPVDCMSLFVSTMDQISFFISIIVIAYDIHKIC